MFFSRASTTELVSLKDAFDGFGLELLHLMIEAESLLLEREFDQRLRLATLLSRLFLSKIFPLDVFTSIDSTYTWRSDYVHSGDDVFPEYGEEFNIGEVQKTLYLLRHVIAKFIHDAPKILDFAEIKARERIAPPTPLSDKNRVTAWFDILQKMWSQFSPDLLHHRSKFRLVGNNSTETSRMMLLRCESPFM